MGYPRFRFLFDSWGWVWFRLSSEYPELEPDLGTQIFRVPAQHWFFSSVKPLAMNFMGIGLTLIFPSWSPGLRVYFFLILNDKQLHFWKYDIHNNILHIVNIFQESFKQLPNLMKYNLVIYWIWVKYIISIWSRVPFMWIHTKICRWDFSFKRM